MLRASRCVSAILGFNLPSPIAKAGVVEDPTVWLSPSWLVLGPIGWCALRLQKPLVVSRFLLKIAGPALRPKLRFWDRRALRRLPESLCGGSAQAVPVR